MTRSRLAFFTICSNNYVPMARLFLASARRVHPEADLFLCLADRVLAVEGLYGADAAVVPIEALDVPDLPGLCFRYDVMELNTAVKPFMMLHLLERRGYDTVLYFDPDIEIHAPLSGVLAALAGGASFALTPHVLRPAEGGEGPDDLSFLRAGSYNLGFLAVRDGAEARDVLGWWARRLLFQCVDAQAAGLFVDQKFMDLLPSLAGGVAVLRDPALNVAYWNLPQRHLARGGDGWTVDGRPLGFFHFSGFDPRRPGRLSKYTPLFGGGAGEAPGPALQALLDDYAARLLALGHGRIPAATYAFGRFASGTPIPPAARRLFRERHSGWPDDPFATFEAFLDRPRPGVPVLGSAVVVTRLLAYLHETVPHLAAHVELGTAAGQERLADWFVKHAPREMPLDPRLLEPVALRLRDRLPPVPGPGAVVLAVGDDPDGGAADAVLRGLRGAGLRVEGAPPHAEAAARGDGGAAAAHASGDAATGHGTGAVPPRGTDGAAPCGDDGATHAGEGAGTARRLVVAAAGEAAQTAGVAYRIALPAGTGAAGGLEGADEVWACSRHRQLVLARRLGVPVLHVPLPLEAPAPAPPDRAALGLPEGRFLFLGLPEAVAPDDPAASGAATPPSEPSGGAARSVALLVEAFGRAFPPGGRRGAAGAGAGRAGRPGRSAAGGAGGRGHPGGGRARLARGDRRPAAGLRRRAVAAPGRGAGRGGGAGDAAGAPGGRHRPRRHHGAGHARDRPRRGLPPRAARRGGGAPRGARPRPRRLADARAPGRPGGRGGARGGGAGAGGGAARPETRRRAPGRPAARAGGAGVSGRRGAPSGGRAGAAPRAAPGGRLRAPGAVAASGAAPSPGRRAATPRPAGRIR